MTRLQQGVMLGMVLAPGLISPAAAHASRHKPHRSLIVAYDAKDKRYYSVAWAKAHGMHDKGGDALSLRPLAGLPKDAKMSRAMAGKL